jgi:hypothetical protein
MSILYRKTIKGQYEIDSRVNGLSPRVRSLLILVDGKRDAVDLCALVARPASAQLAELAAQGFIEAVGETLDHPPGEAPPMAVAAPAPGAPPPQPLAGLRRSIVRALNEELGRNAQPLAARMRRSRNVEELRPLVTQAVQLVVAAHGRNAADAFAARLPRL